MKELIIKTSPSYAVQVGVHYLEAEISTSKKIIVITDDNVGPLYAEPLAEKYNAKVLTMPAGEQHKTREKKQQLEDQMLEQEFGRDTLVIALGGGVVTDMTGFIASTYCRGVDVVYMPTSLLAMVDASIGGKTGVNTPHGKNLIGTFSQPKAVFIDPNFLQSLPEKEFKNGMVELIKHALIASTDLFKLLLKHSKKIQALDNGMLIDVIFRSCQIKAHIVEQDEKEQSGVRQILNAGHTIGHALESYFQYTVGHGQAVAAGLIAESEMACQQGIQKPETLALIKNMFDLYQIDSVPTVPQEKLKPFLKLDKKSEAGVPKYIFIKDIGCV